MEATTRSSSAVEFHRFCSTPFLHCTARRRIRFRDLHSMPHIGHRGWGRLTSSSITTVYLSENEHMKFNDSTNNQKYLLIFESRIHFPTILTVWLKFKIESIKCKNVTFSLISLRVSKIPFIFHCMLLYLILWSPLLLYLSIIIAVTKLILLVYPFSWKENGYFIRLLTAPEPTYYIE